MGEVYRARHQAWARGRAEAPAVAVHCGRRSRGGASNAKHECSHRSIIHTSGQSTVSKTPATYRLWCWSWSRATRCTIAFTGARATLRRHWPSRQQNRRRARRRPSGPADHPSRSHPPTSRSRADGVVKVLDFGLAKALAAEGSSSDLSKSPTITAVATIMGAILGTAAYMSPEQARGQPVDKRNGHLGLRVRASSTC